MNALHQPNILIVDDLLINRMLLIDILNNLGCQSAVAKNGEEAVNMVCEQHFDLILMDLEMPVMNGIETTAFIRSHEGLNKQTPIIALTAHSEDEITEDMNTVGFTNMLGKPFLPGKIKHLIDSYCR